METRLLHFFVILLLIFYLCLQQCKTDQVRAFKKSCDQVIDCGTNHVIAIADVIKNKMHRVAAKNRCNGQQKCYLPEANCSIEYYCIDNRFVQNCSIINQTKNIENSFDLIWCYKKTNINQPKKKSYCWEFLEDVYHHWIILRGWMKIKTNSDVDGKSMLNFKVIKSSSKSKVCTSSKYIWIIYVGTKSPNTTVNIFSKSDPTLTDLDQVTDMNKNDSNEEAMFKRRDKTDNLQNSFSVDDDTNQNNNNNNNNNMNVLKIIIIISVTCGALILLAITVATLWCCCRRCNNVTITKPVKETMENSHDVKNIIAEDPNCQMRDGFIPTGEKRDTCDSIGFWTDDEDYDPNDDSHSKIQPHIYAMGNCIYRRQSSKSEIYMNSVIPPPPTFEKEKDLYINMNTKPMNKHFNVYL